MWFPSFLRSWTGPSALNRSKRQRRQPACIKQASARPQVEELEHRWCPSFSLVTSRTALAGTDSLNWGTLGPPAPQTIVANPFTILSAGGRSVSVSQPTQFGPFAVFEQTPPTTANTWNGNFAPGDTLLYGGNPNYLKKSDPYTLNFGATPVAAGGAQIESNYVGKFTAEVQALDASGNVLASFTEGGNATQAADNSAIFIGISSTSDNIYQIALSLTRAPSSTIGEFAINQFDFRTSPLAAVTPATASTIERTASAPDLAPPASSLLGTGQQALPARTASTLGGGIANGGALTVGGRAFTSHFATSSTNTGFFPPGAGGDIYSLGTATLQECTLPGKNSAGSAGGGIYNGASGTLTLDDSDVCGDFALLGADVYNLGKATLDDSTLGVIGP
jgi:hypothetical protein